MKNRNHIDSKVLAQAAKWSKPKLRKRYTYAPKKMTVGKYVRDSKDPKLQRKYAKYMKKEGAKRKSMGIRNSDDKVYNKWESMNNFSNLKSQNLEFAQQKNRDRKKKKLAKLDNLAWESVAIPANDQIFGCLDGKGNECGVGQLQVIESKDFFANYNVNELHIEEYVLGSNTNTPSQSHDRRHTAVYDDSMGLKHKLDIARFNTESSELLKLIEFSLHKLSEATANSGHEKEHKTLQRKKSMKQKAEEKKLKALERKFEETILLTRPDQIEQELLVLLSINADDTQRELKRKTKHKWQQGRLHKLNTVKEPPLKKRKCEFRSQIGNLHEKQNIKHIANKWNSVAEPESLNELLLKGIADLGFHDATAIQKEVIPVAMNGANDVLIASATGSGKTLCFGIPIVHDLVQNADGLDAHLYGLVVTPTRELAIQIEAHLKALCKYCGIQCVAIVGGMSLPKQKRLLRSSPEIVVATPGRIWQMMKDNESLHLRDLTNLRYLVLDEADRLLSCSHYGELNHILNIIKTIWSVKDYKAKFTKQSAESESEDAVMQFLEETPSKLTYRRQTFIVSATLTLESVNRQSKTESKMPIFANLATLVPFQENISMIDQTPRHRTTQNVMEYEIAVVSSDKDAMAAYLLQSYRGRTLLFANTIGSVKRITLILKEVGFTAHCIHSQQQQRQRLKNLDRFVNTAQCVLICTDICARGLDIPCVDNIIHFQCPLSAEDYIHRTGRVGRHETVRMDAEAKVEADGNSFLLICADESKLYNKIILALKRPQGLTKLSMNERLVAQIRRQVSIAKRIAAVLDDTRRKHRKASNLKKMADAAGIELDEINCRALNIMKRNKSKRNKHESFEYAVDNENAKQSVHKSIQSLRNQLKQLKTQNDWTRPKSSYLTKKYIFN